jgi:hypothetical protein
MFTYDVISESVRNPQALAAELSRRSALGWDLVQIINDDSVIHAFVRRTGGVPAATASVPYSAAAQSTTAPFSAVAATTSGSATPSVPADWYKDPSGRFELRYWNGSAWTEHVATGGTQSTDAPR